MSVASDIKAAVAFTGLPCAQVSYDGDADTYFVFNMDAIPDNFADDEAQADRWLVQLHLFAPFKRNTMELRRQIRAAIRDVLGDYPSLVDASEGVRAADGTEQHIVFEFEIATGVE